MKTGFIYLLFSILAISHLSMVKNANAQDQEELIAEYNDMICISAIEDTFKGFNKQIENRGIEFAEAVRRARCKYYHNGYTRTSSMLVAIIHDKETPARFANAMLLKLIKSGKHNVAVDVIMANAHGKDVFEEIFDAFESADDNKMVKKELYDMALYICKLVQRNKVDSIQVTELTNKYC